MTDENIKPKLTYEQVQKIIEDQIARIEGMDKNIPLEAEDQHSLSVTKRNCGSFIKRIIKRVHCTLKSQ